MSSADNFIQHAKRVSNLNLFHRSTSSRKNQNIFRKSIQFVNTDSGQVVSLSNTLSKND